MPRQILEDLHSTSGQDFTKTVDDHQQVSAGHPEFPSETTMHTGIHDDEDTSDVDSGNGSSSEEPEIPSDDDLFDWPEAPKRNDNDDAAALARTLQEQMTVSENNLIRNYEDIQNLVRRNSWETLDDDLKHLAYIVQKIGARPDLLGYFDESLAGHIHSRGGGQVGILAGDVREWWRTVFFFPGRGEVEAASGEDGDVPGDDVCDLSRVTVSAAGSEVSSEGSDLADEKPQGASQNDVGHSIPEKGEGPSDSLGKSKRASIHGGNCCCM
ncbi:hypothetical protein VMCG_05654 [Cytospora schulzeri]|uniref:Uncharacterized protein n=1 Tax=Cytospora schulzeri TaxID=448051 RepID=A0A423WF88_9PEZI|nr:hypothetical protein VMCG_05654 [Valsa malicola]